MCEKLISFINHLNPNHFLKNHEVHQVSNFLLLFLLELPKIIRLILQICLKQRLKLRKCSLPYSISVPWRKEKKPLSFASYIFFKNYYDI